MANLKGLQYIGTANGITVMLYKSYKSVTITWDKPYLFTSRDNTSDEARKYYLRNYLPLGLRLVEEQEIDMSKADTLINPEPEEHHVDEHEEAPAEEKKEEQVVSEGETAGSQKEDEHEDETPDKEDRVAEEEAPAEEKKEDEPDALSVVVKAIVTEHGREAIESASIGDLGEILDSKLTDDQVKEMSHKVGYDYGRTRNKYKIINGMLENDLAGVVAFLLA